MSTVACAGGRADLRGVHRAPPPDRPGDLLRGEDPAPAARAVRDAELTPLIARVHRENYGVYGARKMHPALRRDGVEIGRDQTARLMRELGLAGVRRGTVKRTTIREDAAARPADLVNRGFRAPRPDRLWVAELTYIRTWVGFAYLALVIDVFSRRIVGWAVAGHMRTDLPLEALELACGPASSPGSTASLRTPTPAV